MTSTQESTYGYSQAAQCVVPSVRWPCQKVRFSVLDLNSFLVLVMCVSCPHDDSNPISCISRHYLDYEL